MGDNGLIFSSAKERKWVLIIMIMAVPKTLESGIGAGIAMAEMLCHFALLSYFDSGSFKRNLANAENFKGII